MVKLARGTRLGRRAAKELKKTFDRATEAIARNLRSKGYQKIHISLRFVTADGTRALGSGSGYQGGFCYIKFVNHGSGESIVHSDYVNDGVLVLPDRFIPASGTNSLNVTLVPTELGAKNHEAIMLEGSQSYVVKSRAKKISFKAQIHSDPRTRTGGAQRGSGRKDAGKASVGSNVPLIDIEVEASGETSSHQSQSGSISVTDRHPTTGLVITQI